MALKKSVQMENGVSVNDAYHRVECIMHPTKSIMVSHLRSYAMRDESAPHDQFFTERVMSCDFDMYGNTAWAQAYKHVMTMAEFGDAVDC